ncbi:CD225/dispanin family protein [Rhodococcus opacus]|nr:MULTISPECIES: CD225/dispanin family protein [Rhodococcus]
MSPATADNDPDDTPGPDPVEPLPVRSASIRPPTHGGWAAASLLFFWPLSFAAFTHAFNVQPLWADGDAAGAQHASDRVRRLGQISVVIGCTVIALLAALYVLTTMVLLTNGDSGVGYDDCGFVPGGDGGGFVPGGDGGGFDFDFDF